MTRKMTFALFLTVFVACSENPIELATPEPDTRPLDSSPLVTKAGVGKLMLGMSVEEVTAEIGEILWTGGIADGYDASWYPAYLSDPSLAGVSVFFRFPPEPGAVDMIQMKSPFAGRTIHGIGIGTHRRDVERLIEGSDDYYRADWSVVCLGGQELFLGFGRADAVETMSFFLFVDKIHYICPDHLFGHAP